MTTDQLQAILADRNVTLSRHADAIDWRGPSESMTPALLRVLRVHKESLLERLQDEGARMSPVATPVPSFVAIGLCWPGCEQPYKTVPANEYFALREAIG